MKILVPFKMVATIFVASACTDTVSNEAASGAAVGGVLGAVTATALGADTDWLVVGTLVGAATGAIVAENQRTGQCAYARGDGTYYSADC